jgi:hypothetical protein
LGSKFTKSALALLVNTDILFLRQAAVAGSAQVVAISAKLTLPIVAGIVPVGACQSALCPAKEVCGSRLPEFLQDLQSNSLSIGADKKRPERLRDESPIPDTEFLDCRKRKKPVP